MNFRAIALDDIPVMGNVDNPYVKLVMEFLESGAEAAEVEEMHVGLGSATSALRSVCRRANLPIDIKQRQKRLFLIRRRAVG